MPIVFLSMLAKVAAEAQLHQQMRRDLMVDVGLTSMALHAIRRGHMGPAAQNMGIIYSYLI